MVEPSKKKISKKVNMFLNLFIFFCFIVSGSIMVFINWMVGSIILILLALYMLFNKIDNLEKTITGEL